MEATNYKSIGPVLQLNKAGELTQKRMKAVNVCDGLYISEPNKTQLVNLVIEYNGVMWIEHTTPAKHVDPESLAKRMPAILKNIEDGKLATMDEYRQEINRRIFSPDSPAIMELKKPERKKPAQLADNERKVNVLMFKMLKGSIEMTDKKAVITEVAPHVYKYAYKLNRFAERVKIIFEIDGVYFQRSDNGAYLLECEDFTEVCTKAYERARDDVAAGAANGGAYFIEVQKRIDAATPSEAPQISTKTAETVNVSMEGENAAERAENKPTFADVVQMVKTELAKNKAIRTTWKLEFPDGTECNSSHKCTVAGCDFYEYTEARNGEDVFKDYKATERDITLYICQRLELDALDPPQSPETPQRVECTTDTPEPRETARKRQNRAIGSAQQLGAIRYAIRYTP